MNCKGTSNLKRASFVSFKYSFDLERRQRKIGKELKKRTDSEL